MTRFGISLIIGIILSFVTANAQSSDNALRNIQTSVVNEDWSKARLQVETLRNSNPSLFSEKGLDYLLGRIADKLDDPSTASTHYQNTLRNQPILSEYAFWHLARIARATGDLVLEREQLRRLVATGASSVLFEAASLRLAESYFESGDYQSTINSLSAITTSKNISLSREALALSGSAYLRANKPTEARDIFTKLLMQMPDASKPDDFALSAVRELDSLEGASNKTLKLTEAEHLLRASVYQFNRDFAGARIHYQALIDDYPQSGTVPNAMYQLGRGLYLEAKYDEAVKVFQTVSTQYGQTSSAQDALSFLAASYVRMKRTDDAVATYKAFINRFPNAPNPERPFLNIIDALHEAGRYTEALSWAAQTRARFRTDLGGALALFAQMRIHLAQAGWSDVIRDADELSKLPDLGGARVPGGTTKSEVTFLRTFAFEQLGRIDDAINSYLSIPDGRSEYYGARATQRLRAMSTTDKTRNAIKARLQSTLSACRTAVTNGQLEQARALAQTGLRLAGDGPERLEFLGTLRRAYQLLPSYSLPSLPTLAAGEFLEATDTNNHAVLANALNGLGLYDEGLPELLAARPAAALSSAPVPTASTDVYTIAVMSLRGGLPNRAIRFGEQLWKPIPADYVLDVAPRHLVELLYPAPFRDSLLKHASSRNIDPRFVLSIARQESRFQVDAKSVAAARGMMQFIPSTANEVAAELNLKSFVQDDLYYADTAILFGSEYLARLFKQFPDQPQAVAASYNGGADNVARWVARSRSNDADRYVPEIGFSQSKDYVYRVMANFWNYQQLYDAQLKAQTISK